MIQESYCSFEVAKLLKEKGFDELCIFKYNLEGIKVKAGKAIDEWSNTELEEGECSAPTHQLAMRWLRETKDIHLAILHSNKVGYWFTWSNESGFYESDEYHKTYEEATEAGLKYALEVLI